MSFKLLPLIKTCHKWLSLVVGLQLLIWLGTGLYFNVMDHEKAKGSRYLVKSEAVITDLRALVEPNVVLKHFPPTISLKQITILNQPYYLLTHDKGLYPHFNNTFTLVDAITGKQVLVDESFAKQIALASYKGPGQIVSAVKRSAPFEDRLKEQNPLWRVEFDDELHTTAYLDAGSGRLIGHANDDKRIVDLIFMLHFMDYAQEGSFNNIQIIVFAIFTLFFALTGLIWTIELGFNGQYKVGAIFGGLTNTKSIDIFDKNNMPLNTLEMLSHENLLDSLLKHNIALPSTCAGGGTCGRCKIKVSEAIRTTSADRAHFDAAALSLGYRLACQHTSSELEQLTLLDVTQASNHQLTLISSEFISPYIKELRFAASDGQAISFKAGAYMRFFIPAAKGVAIPVNLPPELMHHWQDVVDNQYDHLACSRNYSLANGDGKSNQLVFTIKIQMAPDSVVKPGIGSSYICNLAVGETIEAVGPFEDFYAAESSDNNPMVLIGAGSGMAPLKALIEEQLIKLGRVRPIHFYFGARSQADLIYAELFESLSATYPNFHYVPVLSRASDNWQGASGYVQTHLAADFDAILSTASPSLSNSNSKSESKSACEFYLCGPTAMMNSSIELLKSKGVKDSQIAFDDFS